jgi:hypothetical protein
MTDTVRVFDFATKKVTTVPASELAPGMARMKIEGLEGEYFVEAGQIDDEGEIKHPPFSEEVRDYFRSFAATFADVYPGTVEEWEDGFRRDTHPAKEIAVWSVIERHFKHFTEGRWLSVEQKDDIFKVILACSVNGPDFVLQTTNPRTLSRKRVKQIADYCRGSKHREQTQPHFMEDEQRTDAPIPKVKGGSMNFSKLFRNPFGGDNWAEAFLKDLGEHRAAVLETAHDAIWANRRVAVEQGVENPAVLILDVSDQGARDLHRAVDPNAPLKYAPQQQVVTIACHPRRAAEALKIHSSRSAEMIVTPPPEGRDTWVALVSEGKTKLMAFKMPEAA